MAFSPNLIFRKLPMMSRKPFVFLVIMTIMVFITSARHMEVQYAVSHFRC
jgi:hypothetical protein